MNKKLIALMSLMFLIGVAANAGPFDNLKPVSGAENNGVYYRVMSSREVPPKVYVVFRYQDGAITAHVFNTAENSFYTIKKIPGPFDNLNNGMGKPDFASIELRAMQASNRYLVEFLSNPQGRRENSVSAHELYLKMQAQLGVDLQGDASMGLVLESVIQFAPEEHQQQMHQMNEAVLGRLNDAEDVWLGEVPQNGNG